MKERFPFPLPFPFPTSTRPVVPSPAPTDQAQANLTLLALQNAERARNGKPPLTLHPELIAAAQVQANFCASRNQLTHTGVNGSTVGDRVTSQGYRWSAAAENASMQPPAPAGWPGPDPRSADFAVQGWLESPGHRANMLGPYAQCGAGYADAENGIRYWVVTFATPQASR
jgi:uncharacterized protein YkwD